jgi:AhpD family alkylhydroperoxidase
MSETRIPPTEIDGVYGWVVKRFSKKLLGEVPEGVGVLWHNRKVLTDTMKAGQKAQKWDALDADLTTYTHMAVAALVGCSWCLDFNYFAAHNEGLDEAKASQVPRWRESDVFTPLERDVMDLAEGMTVTPPQIDDEVFARLLAQLGAAAMVELAALVGFANLTTRSNVAMGIESQGFSKACKFPLAQRSTRPSTQRSTQPSGQAQAEATNEYVPAP